MEPQKIVIVQVALSHGGAEQVGILLANGLQQRGHLISIYTDLTEPVLYQVNKGIHITDFVGKKTNVIIKWLKAVYLIRKQVKSEKPNVIIGIMGLCTFIAYISCLGLKIPIVMTEHNSFERPDSAPMPLSLKIFKFWINKLYKNITVLTEADKKVIGNKLKNITVMPNPLLLKPVNDIPLKEKMVLAVGRVNGWHVKGFDILLQAWSKIISNEQLEISNYDYSQDGKLSHWWLKIAGDGKLESFEYLMNLLPDGEWVFNDNVNDNDKHSNTKNTEEKGIDTDKLNSQKCGVWRSEKYRIEFLGFQKDMETLYKKSSVFVLSSRYEGFGLVLIEAMSQGCAPIATDFKGRTKEIITSDKEGLTCNPEDIAALAAGIQKLMADEELRKTIQQNAIERSKFFSLDNIISLWEKFLYNDMIIQKS